MPDKRTHRGPHPEDSKLFGAAAIDRLRSAAHDYLWLLNRGYAEPSSLKLVGDRYRLTHRQRIAVARSVCSDQAAAERMAKTVGAAQLAGCNLVIDGFNVVVTLEVALGGGVVLQARDSCYRDMSSMHGSYRKTAQTAEAIELVGRMTDTLGLAGCRWYFDRPVSNSGRLVELVRQLAARHGWAWTASTVQDPDQALVRSPHVMATADSAVLDRGGKWFNLARAIIDRWLESAWIVDFAGCWSPCGNEGPS